MNNLSNISTSAIDILSFIVEHDILSLEQIQDIANQINTAVIRTKTQAECSHILYFPFNKNSYGKYIVECDKCDILYNCEECDNYVLMYQKHWNYDRINLNRLNLNTKCNSCDRFVNKSACSICRQPLCYSCIFNK